MISANGDAGRTRAYHDRTAHSPESVRADRHRLDWAIKPAPFKLYPDLPAIALPRDIDALGTDALAAVSGPLAAPAALDLPRLASLLHHAAGVTKTKAYPGGETMYYRAAPSTGALYQTEVYVVAGDVEGLDAGVYHFSPGDFALRLLRGGDYRGALAQAAADDALAQAPAAIALAGLYWRNTWKYQARGYRHLFWDSGALASHLLAAARALDTPARCLLGFVDAEVNALLGLDAAVEGALLLVACGGHARAAGPPPPVAAIAPAVVPLSEREVSYPLLVEAYADSSLEREPDVLLWRDAAAALAGGAGEGGDRRGGPDAGLAALPAPADRAMRALGETIHARGSTREFSGEAVSAADLGTALYHATRGFAADVPPGLVDCYLTVHAVEGVEPGAYLYHPRPHALELVKRGDFRADAAFLCLEQALGGMSSATVFFLTDLGRVLGALGNRGYRAANFEAGLIGGRLYLAAYAQRFGATGLTFYDGPVVAFFSPHAHGKDALFVTALGRSVRRAPRAPAPLGIARRTG